MSGEKVRENRLRRMAERQALELRKIRRRDPRAVDFGRWWIVDTRTGAVATFLQGDEYGLTLDEVEEWLMSDPSERATSPLIERRT